MDAISRRWILGSTPREILFIYLPGLLATLFGIVLSNDGPIFFLWAFLTLAVIDSGHIYTTIWRSFLRREEFIANRKLYLLIPLVFFSLFFFWEIFGLPYLWSFVLYVTAFHNIRQHYGFSRWYQKINRRSDNISSFFLYLLTVIPLLLYHFRQNVPGGIYSAHDLFTFSNMEIFSFGKVVYYAVLTLWLVYELYLCRMGIQEWNRFMSIAYPAFLYGFGFLYGRSMQQILFPILAGHGLPYFAVMSLSLNRLDKIHFPSFYSAMRVIVVTAFLFGSMEVFAEKNVIVCENNWNNGQGFLASLITALYLVPLFCHYSFDAFLWRRGHRESSIIYNTA